jgi:alpha-tubulin suppressor-like RCC1 family protein
VQQIQASDHAFAAFLADGTVVSWGVFEEGLDTATYANYLAALRNVQKIQATSNSFAAIHADGSVNCWGSFLAGNNAKKDLHVLGKVVDLSSSRTSFAASMLRDDGYKGIAWWGENDNPGFFGVRLTEPACAVIEIQSNDFAFAALLADGSVVSCGTYTHGGDSEDIQDQLKNIQFIASTTMAFCAVTNDGKVVTWGRGDEGGDSSAIQRQLSSLM